VLVVHSSERVGRITTTVNCPIGMIVVVVVRVICRASHDRLPDATSRWTRSCRIEQDASLADQSTRRRSSYFTSIDRTSVGTMANHCQWHQQDNPSRSERERESKAADSVSFILVHCSMSIGKARSFADERHHIEIDDEVAFLVEKQRHVND
jgi:hypothetical protein